MSKIIATYVKDPDAIKTYTVRWGAADWATPQGYVVDDAVYDPTDSKFYRCTIAHTSGASRSGDSANWEEISGGLFLPTGTTLSSDTWTVPSGITKDSESNTSHTSVITVSGGTDKTTYILDCHGVFSDGDEDDRSIRIKVRDV